MKLNKSVLVKTLLQAGDVCDETSLKEAVAKAVDGAVTAPPPPVAPPPPTSPQAEAEHTSFDRIREEVRLTEEGRRIWLCLVAMVVSVFTSVISLSCNSCCFFQVINLFLRTLLSQCEFRIQGICQEFTYSYIQYVKQCNSASLFINCWLQMFFSPLFCLFFVIPGQLIEYLNYQLHQTRLSSSFRELLLCIQKTMTSLMILRGKLSCYRLILEWTC